MAASLRRATRELDPTDRREAIIDRVGQLYMEATQSVVLANVLETARQWLPPGVDFSGEESEFIATTAMLFAAEVDIFKPSFSGKTLLDRFTRNRKLGMDEAVALSLLKSARLTLLRIKGINDRDIFIADDLLTGKTVQIYDYVLPPTAVGFTLFCRLYPLDAEVFGTICSIVPLDSAGIAVAMDFARPGKGFTNPHRCAAAVFRHVIRNGGAFIPGYGLIGEETFADENEHDDERTAIDAIVVLWASLATDEKVSDDSIDDVRNLSSPETILEALFKSVAVGKTSPLGTKIGDAYRRIATLQMETLQRRALAGSGRETGTLDDLAALVDNAVAAGHFTPEAAAVFAEIRRSLITRAKPKQKPDELTRVIERIRALRAKTVDQGCTEDEVIAAAAKVAELLDRYGLSLSETEVRQQTCEGLGIESTRKRAGPLDDCLPAVARFCDCRAWMEKSASGTLRSVLFGLPADVEAARYLYGRVSMAFEVETSTFQGSDLYRLAVGAERRTATTSFQLGLSRGIVAKLDSMKNERDSLNRTASGRDLVPLKTSVVEEDLAKLGLAFKSRTQNRSRRVQPAAYKAGEAAGRTFVAREVLE